MEAHEARKVSLVDYGDLGHARALRHAREGGAAAICDLMDREEAVDFDCKLKASPNTPTLEKADKLNLGKTLSAFVNSAGGLLLWGVNARLDRSTDIDRIVDFQPISELARFKHELERHSTEALMPRLTDIAIAAIPDANSPDRGFVSMYVQRSERRPHRCELVEKAYYRRAGSSSRMMEHFEIEDAFKRGATPELSLEFRVARGTQLRGPPTATSSILIWLELSNQSLVSARFPYVHVSGMIQPFLIWDELSAWDILPRRRVLDVYGGRWQRCHKSRRISAYRLFYIQCAFDPFSNRLEHPT